MLDNPIAIQRCYSSDNCYVTKFQPEVATSP